jgi:malonyl-CoA O-methyltransferase
MFDKKRIQQDFSHAAAGYDNHTALQHTVLAALLEKVKPHLSRTAQILDAGCGTGRLAKELPTHKIVQLDVAFAMCAKVAKKGPTVNATMEALPFADATFDIVFSSLVLQWLPDWQHAIYEMKRVLKPGGVLAVSTFGDGTLEELKESFATGDRYPHVSWFLPASEFHYKETIIEYFPDLKSLMKHLKAIGARNKLINRRKSLMTQRQLQAVENYYREHFGTPKGLPVTWEVLYSVIEKS